jgi:hypothetical protein
MMKWFILLISTLTSIIAFTQSSNLELHDLYEPPPVLFRFETPGWCILAGILFIILLIITILRFRKYIKNKYRRKALYELEHGSLSVPQIFVILKNTAMSAFGREKAGSLYGNDWLTFLDKTGKNVRMTHYREPIAKAVYEGKVINGETQQNILSNAKKWVKSHAG